MINESQRWLMIHAPDSFTAQYLSLRVEVLKLRREIEREAKSILDKKGIINRKAKKWGVDDAPERKPSLKAVRDNIAQGAEENIGQGEKTQENEKNKPRGGV